MRDVLREFCFRAALTIKEAYELTDDYRLEDPVSFNDYTLNDIKNGKKTVFFHEAKSHDPKRVIFHVLEEDSKYGLSNLDENQQKNCPCIEEFTWLEGKTLFKEMFVSASNKGNLNLVRKLLGKLENVDVNSQKPENVDVNSQNAHGETGLMLASKNGHMDIVDLFLGEKDVDVKKADNEGNTALSHAFKGKSVLKNEIVKKLLEKMNIDDMNIINIYGYTVLMGAAINNDLEVLRILLNKGADPNVVGGTEGIAFTALLLASINNYYTCVQELLKSGADPSKTYRMGNTVLHMAANSGYTETVLELIDKMRPEDIDMKNAYGRTAIEEARMSNNPDIADAILSKLQMKKLAKHIKHVLYAR